MKVTLGVLFSVMCFLNPLHAQNLITVSAVGGDYASPVDALNAIGTTLPAATAGNRYVVKVLPGRYTVTSPVVMKPYVDLEGSGQRTTLIKGAVNWKFGGDTVGVQGVVNAASRSEIRHMTIRNSWSESSAIGIGMSNTRGSVITDVKTIARGNADNSAAWKYGMRIVDSQNVRLTHVTTRGTSNDPTACQGVAVRNSNIRVENSNLVGAECTIGIGLTADDNSTVQVRDSRLRGGGTINGISVTTSSDEAGEINTIRVINSVLTGEVLTQIAGEFMQANILISHSELTGPVRGAPVCIGSHDANLSALGSDCLP